MLNCLQDYKLQVAVGVYYSKFFDIMGTDMADENIWMYKPTYHHLINQFVDFTLP